MLLRDVSALALALLATGCAEHLVLLERNVTGLPRTLFWPPPEATSVWASGPAGSPTFGEAAERIARTFQVAGYGDEGWYPIGVDYTHGFALTTRLERTSDDGAPKPRLERWSALYPEASTLPWLAWARETRLPSQGRYRVFFVAFTDLPIGPSKRAPRWNEETLLASPDMPPMSFPAARRASAGYRVGVYVYEYASDSPDGKGAFVGSDSEVPAARHLERAGLGAL